MSYAGKLTIIFFVAFFKQILIVIIFFDVNIGEVFKSIVALYILVILALLFETRWGSISSIWYNSIRSDD